MLDNRQKHNDKKLHFYYDIFYNYLRMEVIKISEELRKELTVMNTLEIEPNYTELGRRYKVEPRTIKKYNNGYHGKPVNKPKTSRISNQC